MATLSSKFPHRLDPECGPKCRSRSDVSKMIGVLSQPSCSEEAILYMLSCGGICGGPAGRSTDKLGRSLLHVASSTGRKKVAEWLLKYKDSVLNSKDAESGYTALARAIFYGQIHVAVFLIGAGANLALVDASGLSPLDHAFKDAQILLDLRPENPCEVYVWGANSNFNLGIGHQQQRSVPDTLEFFRREGIFIRSIVLRKFHSAFLASDGRVYTCGHGRGGRLGHGSEESQLSPKPVSPSKNLVCSAVALGADHSVFLSVTNGSVWTCGTNSFHQLGIYPPPKLITEPQLISSSKSAGAKKGHSSSSTSSPKLPPALGIGAGRFHSLFWTKSSLYTWGLNAGQLGHLKGDKTQCVPKVVSSLNQKEVSLKMVACSDGAIVVLTDSGDIFILHEYQTRRMTSKQHDVAKMEVIGGHLDPKVISRPSSGSSISSPSSLGDQEFGFKLVEKGGQELKVFILSKVGRISVWCENRSSHMIPCTFNLNRELIITDIGVNKSNLIMISKDGIGYEGIHSATSSNSNKAATPGKSAVGSSKATRMDLIRIKRLPGIFRGAAVACDSKGRNFAVLQILPNASMYEIPEVESSDMVKDLEQFRAETNNMDLLHDVVFKAGGRSFPAHKFIVSSVSDKLSKLIMSSCKRFSSSDPYARDENVVEIPDDIDPTLFEQILKFAYTRKCDLLSVGECKVNYVDKTGHEKFDREKKTPSPSLCYKDIPGGNPHQVSAFQVHKANNNSSSNNNKKKSDNKDSKRKRSNESPPTSDRSSNGKEMPDAVRALQEAARSLEVFGLVKALDNFRMQGNMIKLKDGVKSVPRAKPYFSRKSFPELHDVIIQTEDGGEIGAHRCVLAARLEYFRSMFGLGWIETKEGQSLSLPVPTKVLHVIIEYIYRDEASTVEGSDDIELVCNVLVTADQLLMKRLIQICERQLATMITLKNVGEVLQFAFDYNAEQLQMSVMQYISQNLAVVLESKVLATVQEDYLLKLTEYYRKNSESVGRRRIPLHSSVGPSAEEINDFWSKNPLSAEDLFAEEEAVAAFVAAAGAAGARRRTSSRRHSSGDGSSKNNRRVSVGSDSGSESGFPDNPQQDDDDDDSLDELEFEEKLQIKDADRTREALNGVHQNGGGLPSSSSFNGQQGFLASFFEAKTPATAGSEKKPLPSSSKKFAKKSQKERKKELDLLNKEGPVEPEKQQAKKWSGWGTQSPATPEKQQQPPANGLRRDLSLSEIMKAEVISPPPPPSVQPALNAPSSSSQSSVGGTKPKIKKSSWKQLSFTEPEPKGLSSAPAVNPWKKVAATSTTPASKDSHVSSSSSTDFKNILKDEVRQTANLVRAKSKSLEVTQLEEKAIQELLVFYNAKHVTDETIRVERVDEGPLATPVWNKSSIRY